MFSKPISRRQVFKLFAGSAMGLMVSDVSFAGDFRYEPRSEEHYPINLVRAIQNRLKGLGFDPGPIDGIYGPKTKNGIMEFQRSKNLKVDGKISDKLIKELGLEEQFEIIAIAKKDEKKGETNDKIFKPRRTNPITFGKDADLLLFLQRIRDEAHRFAITFHRKRRIKTSLQSELDAIPGIGKKRKTILLKHFKSIKKMREANIEELYALPGINRPAAKAVYRYFNSQIK